MPDPTIKQFTDDLTHQDLYNKIQSVQSATESVQKTLDKWEDKYVTQDQFSPVKGIAYGLATMALITICGAVFNLVVNKTNATGPISNAIIQTK